MLLCSPRLKPSSHFPSAQLSTPGKLQELGSLIVGMNTETFLTLTSDKLLSSLPAMAQHPAHLSQPQCNAVSTKLWVQHTHANVLMRLIGSCIWFVKEKQEI